MQAGSHRVLPGNLVTDAPISTEAFISDPTTGRGVQPEVLMSTIAAEWLTGTPMCHVSSIDSLVLRTSPLNPCHRRRALGPERRGNWPIATQLVNYSAGI